jgi:hypothetical protein
LSDFPLDAGPRLIAAKDQPVSGNKWKTAVLHGNLYVLIVQRLRCNLLLLSDL